ncbi:MAG: thermonuclease family protein [Bdellovibrionales bacterium]|nr:thermonuclease family protein [Bdellovibrionales bacterium]
MQKLSPLLCLLVLFISLASSADSLTGKVVDVHDGDTLTIQVPSENNKKYKVRMLGVDTPEVEFFEHTQGEAAFAARDFLRSLVPVGSTATVDFDGDGFDKHNRVLGRIFADGVEVNREMLKNGWGYFYFIFPFDKKIAVEYSALAKFAVDNQLGLFSAKFRETQPPYEFRLTSRHQIGLNIVGDLQTKRLYSPEDSAQVPVWNRVFFPDEGLAKSAGYSF